ncbi:hypothetical protein GF323_00640 [Candidatus Woesearchaeota archaeon]|nr:hypothetical protein [Candidatus Woesearchaeota archaeon]
MADNITSEQSARIDKFVEGLEGRTREIATSYLGIPNTPDCQPEMMALHFKFGKELSAVTDQVEGLRQELEVHYDVLQPELQKRLYQ